MNTCAIAAPVHWRAVAALTAVSTLAQIGQFGIGFIVLPVWLAHQGLDAPRAGLFAAAQWAGMFSGLLVTPRLVERLDAKLTVTLGLASSLIAYATLNALAWIARPAWPMWLLPGALMGFGIGLRWIANETWLYSLVPAEKSGKVVGVHETLIASAGVLAPSLAAVWGASGMLVFALGSLLTLAAAVPLWLTRSTSRQRVSTPCSARRVARVEFGPTLCLGLVTIAAGGLGDGALYGLFPLFADSRGLTAAQTTMTLACFGIGGVVLQFPVGWLADRFRLAATVIGCAIVSTAAIVLFAFAPPASFCVDGRCARTRRNEQRVHHARHVRGRLQRQAGDHAQHARAVARVYRVLDGGPAVRRPGDESARQRSADVATGDHQRRTRDLHTRHARGTSPGAARAFGFFIVSRRAPSPFAL